MDPADEYVIEWIKQYNKVDEDAWAKYHRFWNHLLRSTRRNRLLSQIYRQWSHRRMNLCINGYTDPAQLISDAYRQIINWLESHDYTISIQDKDQIYQYVVDTLIPRIVENYTQSLNQVGIWNGILYRSPSWSDQVDIREGVAIGSLFVQFKVSGVLEYTPGFWGNYQAMNLDLQVMALPYDRVHRFVHIHS